MGEEDNQSVDVEEEDISSVDMVKEAAQVDVSFWNRSEHTLEVWSDGLTTLVAEIPSNQTFSSSGTLGQVFHVKLSRVGSEIICPVPRQDFTYEITGTGMVGGGIEKGGSNWSYDKQYQVMHASPEFAGFVVCVEAGAFEKEPRLRAQLREDLQEIDRVLPHTVKTALKRYKIWINSTCTFGKANKTVVGRGMCVHWSTKWLQENGNLPCKCGCVEVYNAKDYCEWIKDQPAMLLHELCHVLHREWEAQIDEVILKAYEKAMTRGMYKEVLRYVHEKVHENVEHYACTNHKEYFAELAEAFWSSERFRGDFYPFYRDDLFDFDSVGAEMCIKVFGVSRRSVDELCGGPVDISGHPKAKGVALPCKKAKKEEKSKKAASRAAAAGISPLVFLHRGFPYKGPFTSPTQAYHGSYLLAPQYHYLPWEMFRGTNTGNAAQKDKGLEAYHTLYPDPYASASSVRYPSTPYPHPYTHLHCQQAQTTPTSTAAYPYWHTHQAPFFAWVHPNLFVPSCPNFQVNHRV